MCQFSSYTGPCKKIKRESDLFSLMATSGALSFSNDDSLLNTNWRIISDPCTSPIISYTGVVFEHIHIYNN